MKKNYFLSHEAVSVREAVALKELLEKHGDGKFFVSSDWHSIPSGKHPHIAIEEALKISDEMLVLITRIEAFKNPWINYEVGWIRGRERSPAIIISGGIPLDKELTGLPLGYRQITGNWDTNRMDQDMRKFGVQDYEKIKVDIAKILKQA